MYVVEFSSRGVLNLCAKRLARPLLNAKASSRIKKKAYEELTMTIQKKSLLSSLNTTKKAIVASSTASATETPSVSAPIAARKSAKKKAQIKSRVRQRIASRVRK